MCDEDHAFARTMRKFAELTQEYYKGEVEFDFRLYGELGVEKDCVNFLQQGVAIDYTIMAPSNMVQFAPSIPLTDMPFLFFGLFIDAIPTIIILRSVPMPVAAAGIDPVVFAIIGIVSLAFGLVTPPYGLCLLISAAIGKINVVKVLQDVIIILIPMLAILLLIILFPQIALWLPTTLMPDSFK